MNKISQSDLPPVNEMTKAEVVQLIQAMAKAKKVKKIKRKYKLMR